MDRRTSLKLLALAPLPVVAGCEWSSSDVQHAHESATAAQAAGDGTLQFFTEHEFETVKVLADLVIPADDRSGSASELGVPQFMDFFVSEQPTMQTPMRGGLAWLDMHCRRRFGHPFLEATNDERISILDEIAYPNDAAPGVQHGVVFFTRFRDLTASGFWTTKAGMDDLQYLGNTFVQTWEGAPPAEMERLGLTFDDWETI